MPITAASKATVGELEVASLDSYCLAIDQSVSQFPPGRFQYPMEGWPGNPHLPRALLLFQPLQILKADRFKFLK
jgi:hypothetical protein